MIIIDGPSMNTVPFLWAPFFGPFFGPLLWDRGRKIMFQRRMGVYSFSITSGEADRKVASNINNRKAQKKGTKEGPKEELKEGGPKEGDHIH